MKKGLAAFLVLALWSWNAFAQTDSQPSVPPSSEMMELAVQIEGIGKLLEGDTKLSKEQAEQLLLYLRAVRNSAALTPIMAEWYAKQIQAQLTPEQLAAIQAAEAAPQSTDQTSQTGDTSQSNSTQNQTNTQTNTESNTKMQQTTTTAQLDLNAPNPFAQAPAVAKLDEIIAKLAQLTEA